MHRTNTSRQAKREIILYKNVVACFGLFIDVKGKMDGFYSIFLSTGKHNFLANYV